MERMEQTERASSMPGYAEQKLADRGVKVEVDRTPIREDLERAMVRISEEIDGLVRDLEPLLSEEGSDTLRSVPMGSSKIAAQVQFLHEQADRLAVIRRRIEF